jgi:hypothetical protein
MLTQVYPAGIQRGTTTDVTISGQRNFNGAYRILFEGEGLSAEFVPKEKPDDPKATVNEVKLKVTATADAAQGVRELRVATPRGVSSVGLIVIGDEPEAVESEPNDTPDKATLVTLPLTLNGRVQKSEDSDQFRFAARAGEEVTFSVLAARLQDKIHDLQEHVDPLLVLRDREGRELAKADDTYGADPLLIHRFETDGEYLLEIRDVRYQGNGNWVYRLTATKRPWVTAALPMAVRRGETAALRLVGASLGPQATASWTAPMDGPAGARPTSLRVGDATTNLVSLIVSEIPERLEPPSGQEPGARSQEPLAIPCGVSGRIAAENEADRYPFRATKGQRLWFEVQARRCGSSLDPFLSIFDSAGKEIATNDDAVGKDSRLEWTAPADGDFAVQVRDLNSRGGATFVYHLVARPSLPDFSLRLDGDKAQIGPGGGTAWYVKVQRTGGFDGEVALAVTGLPEGVTALCGTIPPHMTEGCIVLRAAPGAKVAVGNVRVTGTATLTGVEGGKTTLTRDATVLQEIYTPGGGRGHWNVALNTVSVTEPQDITLSLSAERVTLTPGGSAEIEVTVQRKPEYTKGVTLDVILRHLGSIYGNPLPPGVTLDEGASKTLLSESETKGKLVFRAADNVKPVTDLPIGVLGQVSINFVVKVSYATPLMLTVAPKVAKAE